MNRPDFKLPNRSKPTYAEACKSKYAYLQPFQPCMISFWKSSSKNYESAVYICSLFPLYELASSKNNYCCSLIIDNEKDFYIYSNVINELFSIICKWKYVEFYIGNELCYPDEFWLYMHQLNSYSDFDAPKLDIKEELRIFKNKWKTEKKLYYIIKDLFINENVISHYRATWLDGLELDIFIQGLSIGIEYQGIQHYQPLEHWGGKEGFIKRRANDIKKKNLCDKNGIRIIYFTYQEKITPEYVLDRIITLLK